ncbi:unnamed protein product [Musa acuminata subsp. malaccensis]|uniref:(wild Malaysian banana) hypothetical protein n=1 Tax=Musa acuminata subsp. malaccensis TaxID=214687 RepID=A0A804JHQ8_MUSAM|nr:unnamed protein product [Musa acuminata subsp. malaccensis]
MATVIYLVRPNTVSCPCSVTRLVRFRFRFVLSEAYDLVGRGGVGRANAKSRSGFVRQVNAYRCLINELVDE